MRVGFNPNKDKKLDKSDFFHQVIVPIYIPNEKEYFKDSLKILDYCLESLFKTSHAKTYITIVNNGSCKQVVTYLNNLHKIGTIHEVIHTSSIGKLNAILKAVVGHQFDLITVSDADVLFLNNWQDETYKIFNNFKKAGAVCTTPSSKSYKTYTSNIWFEKLFSKELKFSKVKNPKALKMFAQSIGDASFYNKSHLQKYLTVEENNYKAVVGAGHFVTTYRSDIFSKIKHNYSNYSLGGTSEAKLLDIPVIEKGYWRLSTLDNFTYHLGNVYEEWMHEEFKKLKNIQNNSIPIKLHKNRNQYNLIYLLKNKIFSKMFSKKILLKMKGLSAEEISTY
jgi:hypothetical protein